MRCDLIGVTHLMMQKDMAISYLIQITGGQTYLKKMRGGFHKVIQKDRAGWRDGFVLLKYNEAMLGNSATHGCSSAVSGGSCQHNARDDGGLL